MNWQEVSTGLLAVVCGGLGWFLRQLWDAVNDLKNQIHSLEADIRTNFSRRDDVREMFNNVLEAVRRVEDKIDTKADR